MICRALSAAFVQDMPRLDLSWVHQPTASWAYGYGILDVCKDGCAALPLVCSTQRLRGGLKVKTDGRECYTYTGPKC
jgi:hypothetical protein